jgi:hypothetical protein
VPLRLVLFHRRLRLAATAGKGVAETVSPSTDGSLRPAGYARVEGLDASSGEQQGRRLSNQARSYDARSTISYRAAAASTRRRLLPPHHPGRLAGISVLIGAGHLVGTYVLTNPGEITVPGLLSSSPGPYCS